MTERAALQLAVLVFAWVPIIGGAFGAISGASPAGGDGAAAAFDSHVRYLSGLLLAIGVGFLTTVPRIEAEGARFRLLTLLVLTGGLARLGGTVATGALPGAVILTLGMELVVTPLLCLWQGRIAHRAPPPD